MYPCNVHARDLTMSMTANPSLIRELPSSFTCLCTRFPGNADAPEYKAPALRYSREYPIQSFVQECTPPPTKQLPTSEPNAFSLWKGNDDD